MWQPHKTQVQTQKVCTFFVHFYIFLPKNVFTRKARTITACASLQATKPIFETKNGVKPTGVLSQNGTICFAVYIFLSKDLDISEKSSNFAARFEKMTANTTQNIIPTIPGTDNLQEYNIVSYTMLGNKRYIKLNDSPWFLDKVMNDEGYTRFELGDEDYPFYYIKDHLGNIRETYVRTSGNKFCAQRMQYYPSGLPWDESQGASEQPFKYGSKEFVEMHGLDEYDSEARWYYPAIMRTTSMDPLCEKYYSTSPYAWCGNNPVNYVDPDGRDTLKLESNGRIQDYIQSNTGKDVIMICKNASAYNVIRV